MIKNTYQKECAGAGCLSSAITALSPEPFRRQTKTDHKVLSVTGRCCQPVN